MFSYRRNRLRLLPGHLPGPGDEDSDLRLSLQSIWRWRQGNRLSSLRHPSQWRRAPAAARCLRIHDQPGPQLPRRAARPVRLLGVAPLIGARIEEFPCEPAVATFEQHAALALERAPTDAP